MARIGATFTNDASLNLFRIKREMQADLLDHLRESAENIAELARLNVPVETLSVEDAIVVQKAETQGFSGAIILKVGVDPNLHTALVSERKDNSWEKSDYFNWLHEAVYDLGPKSELKDQMVRSINTKAYVGPKYLSRAYESLQGGINRRAGTIVRRRLEASRKRKRARR